MYWSERRAEAASYVVSGAFDLVSLATARNCHYEWHYLLLFPEAQTVQLWIDNGRTKSSTFDTPDAHICNESK